MSELIDKIMSLVEPVTESGCWIYLGNINDCGYGRIWVKGKEYRVHRITYEHFRGPIPSGLVPDHLCRVRCCINPWHIEIVTHKVNILRGESPSAIHAKKTNCPKGHPYTPENTISWNKGRGMGRNCRICVNLRQRIRYHALKKLKELA